MPYRADNDFPGDGARRQVGMAASRPRRARKQRARARLSRASATGLLAAAGALGALGGCGGVAASSSSSSAQPLEISSPALVPGKGLPTLPTRYTCTGKNVSPPLTWGNVPSDTSELALFLLNLAKPHAAGRGALRASVTVAWAVRGLRPTLHGMAAGKLPGGAIPGRRRYSICPPKGGTGEYLFRLYALPSRLPVKPGLSDLELFRRVNKVSSAVGYFISLYHRA